MAAKKSEFKSVAKFGVPVTLLFLLFLCDIFNPFLGIERRWLDLKFSLTGNIYDIYFRFQSVFKNDLREEVNYGFLFGKYIYKKADPKISIAAIDDATTKKYGWPFRRRYYADLFNKLNKYKARVIAMDVLFMDPDRDNPENDRIMIKGMSKYNNIINLVEISGFDMRIKRPIDGIIQNSRYMAQPHADVTLDLDGHIRRMYPFYPSRFIQDEEEEVRIYYSELDKYNPRCKAECRGITIPLLGAAAYAMYKDIPMDRFYSEWGNDRVINLNFRVPVIRPMHPGRNPEKIIPNLSVYRHISVADILEDKLSSEEKEAINGGVVFVGATATGAFDHFPSPYMELTPGVEYHANLLDNLLHDDYLKPVHPLFSVLLMLAVIWSLLLMVARSTRVITIYAVSASLLLLLLNFLALKYHYDIYFPTYFIALFVSYAYLMAYKSIVEGKEKRWIKNTFSQYLSPKVVNVLTNDPSKLTLGGEKRDMTVLFMDIAHFTTISEKMTPEELTRFLNIYLSALTDIILKYDGVIDKYIGDCIMAFWNAPLDLNEHRTMACLSAIECVAKIKEINKTSKFSDKPNMRFGINSGFATVGNMGSNVRFSYTAIGDTVNLASRLEGANKHFGSSIMISENVYSEAKEKIDARFLGKVKVVGKDIPVDVYEPLARKGEMSKDLEKLLRAYEKGLNYFYSKNYSQAVDAFNEAIRINKDDGPSDFYYRLAIKYAREGDGGFDGVFNLTEK